MKYLNALATSPPQKKVQYVQLSLHLYGGTGFFSLVERLQRRQKCNCFCNHPREIVFMPINWVCLSRLSWLYVLGRYISSVQKRSVDAEFLLLSRYSVSALLAALCRGQGCSTVDIQTAQFILFFLSIESSSFQTLFLGFLVSCKLRLDF